MKPKSIGESKLTPKDRNTIKGAIMRAFSRSELHHLVIKQALVTHSDPSRPRVKSWCLCAVCHKPEAKSYVQVDHIVPKIEVNSALTEMTWDELIDKTWCDISNLQAICTSCHDAKSKEEGKLRKKHKDDKKLNTKTKS